MAHAPRRDSFCVDNAEYTVLTEVRGKLNPEYQCAKKPRKFFKKGRCFSALWPNLVGDPESERTVYWKIRFFVVLRANENHFLCVHVTTHHGTGTTNVRSQVQHYAPVIPEGDEVQYHPDEKCLARSPIEIKIENAGFEIHPMSRMNCSNITTLQYNLKVRNIGRLVASSVKLMEEYCAKSMGLPRPMPLHRRPVGILKSPPYIPLTRKHICSVSGVEYTTITKDEKLDTKFESVENPRVFFKKGKVFKVLWPNLVGDPESERAIYWRVRHFVVLQPTPTHSLCMPIDEIGADVTSGCSQYVPVIPKIGSQLYCGDRPPSCPSIHVLVKDSSLLFPPMALDLSQIVAVANNVRVETVGRLPSDSIRLMQDYFVEIMQLLGLVGDEG